MRVVRSKKTAPASALSAKDYLRAHLPEHFFSKFVPETRPVRTRACDHPGCSGVGEHRAPRTRTLDENNPLLVEGARKNNNYYMFCLEHVTEYNAAWDYYDGMSVEEMEHAIRFDGVWNRPSWPVGKNGASVEKKARHAFRNAFSEDAAPEHIFRKVKEESIKGGGSFVQTKMEIDALKVLGLHPPTDFTQIKKRYRLLVKKHHPDLAAQQAKSTEDQDIIRRLNSAFTVLKTLYGEGAV
jgi:hypothetical protein